MDGYTIRLPDEHHQFIADSNINTAEEIRTFLDKKRVQHAAGICAHCGTIVYPGGTTGNGHTVVSSGSPLGNTLNLSHNQEIDLCPKHSENAFSAVTDETITPPELEYLNNCTNYHEYRAERDAIMDAQPGDNWESLILDRTHNGATISPHDRETAIKHWLDSTIDTDCWNNRYSSYHREQLIQYCNTL